MKLAETKTAIIADLTTPAEDTAQGNCGHCPELDRLARAMAGIERELIIIVRALCNGGNK